MGSPTTGLNIMAHNPSVARKPILALEAVNAGYGPIQALKSVSLEIYHGEIVTLIGANGAGKSSLLMTICGLVQHFGTASQRGRIFFEGRDIATLATHKIAHLGIAQVPEGRRVFARMTVQENLFMGSVAAPVATKKKNSTASIATLERVFKLFPILGERAHQRAGTLSGGEQQMLAIGRALMAQPRLLLLDEPSLGLAPQIMRRIFATLKEIVQEGTTIFLVEQNANQALRLADRGYVLANGKICLSGSGVELLANPEVRKAYLGGH